MINLDKFWPELKEESKGEGENEQESWADRKHDHVFKQKFRITLCVPFLFNINYKINESLEENFIFNVLQAIPV